MKRPVSSALVGAALAAVVLSAPGEAWAESADALRKRALMVLAERSKASWRPVSVVTGTSGNDVHIGSVHATMRRKKPETLVGAISAIERISCKHGSSLPPIFHFTLKADGKSGAKLAISVPMTFEFHSSGGSRKPYIEIVSKRGDRRTVHYSKFATFAGDNTDYEALTIYAADRKDAELLRSKPLERYEIPLGEAAHAAASELCAETDAAELTTIARRHKLIK